MEAIPMKRTLVLITFSLFVLAVAALEVTKLKINGKAAEGKVMTVDGKLYVPVSALKAAGVNTSVDGDTLSLSFPAAGGAGQQRGVEGSIGEWLFNGVWRFRVESVEAQSEGYKVNVEI